MNKICRSILRNQCSVLHQRQKLMKYSENGLIIKRNISMNGFNRLFVWRSKNPDVVTSDKKLPQLPFRKRFVEKIINIFTNKKALEIEEHDLSQLEKYCLIMNSLRMQLNYHRSVYEMQDKSNLDLHVHPIFAVSSMLRSSISYNQYMYTTDQMLIILQEKLTKLNQEYSIHIQDYLQLKNTYSDTCTIPDRWLWDVQTALRIFLLSKYTEVLLHESKSLDSILKKEKLTNSRLSSIIDAYLLGTSEDRLLEHFSLYPAMLTSMDLQELFYAMLEPEVHIASKTFLMLKGTHKDHKKKLEVYCKTYLLDKLELNKKSRCVFAWSDPIYNGLKPIADDRVLPAFDLLVGTRNFFQDCTNIPSIFANSYIAERRLHYADKQEVRDTIFQGAIFFIATCILDIYVCIM